MKLGQVWKLKKQFKMASQYPDIAFVGCVDSQMCLLINTVNNGEPCPWIKRSDLLSHYELMTEPIIITNLKGLLVGDKVYVQSEDSLYEYEEPEEEIK